MKTLLSLSLFANVSEFRMYYNPTQCTSTCINFTYVGGELYTDYEVCAFQHYCKCTCPEFIPEV